MTEAAKTNTAPTAPVQNSAAPRRPMGGRGGAGGRGNGRAPGGGGQPGGGRGRGGDRRGRPEREVREFEQKLLELNRVTRVTKGGKRMRFRATLVIGDRKGRVGYGTAKGLDVSMAIDKAYRQAKKNVLTIPLVNETLPHQVEYKFAAAKVLLKPAPKGTGLKAGGPTRMILELAGVPNAVSKLLGSNNKINNAKATFAALKKLGSLKKKAEQSAS